ncbi:hypothetical protein [Corynebacterium neomassiliense]|uniref:hypothetical protein n=1 Tax=Corynebacterium neomassiliense TaxID=2079482 RepID=UPI001030D5C9|nr:hypothetical protein [Corynebacterium neomassiliense]
MVSSRASHRPESWWRERCGVLLEDGDWHGLYRAAMSWRGDGGAVLPEAWLMDACSALLHRRPKTAVHCCDMALHLWIRRPGDRGIIHFVRGLVVADHVCDPRRAVEDLERAADGPAWLRADAQRELSRVVGKAARSRVRTPRVQPPPAYDAAYADLVTGRGSGGRSAGRSGGGSGGSSGPGPDVPDTLPADGTRPELWDPVTELLHRP